MRKLLVIALLFAGLTSQAQYKYLDAFYNKYKDADEAINVQVGKIGTFLAASFSGDETLNGVLKKVSRVHVLVMPGDHTPSSFMSDLKDLQRALSRDNFEELVTVRDGKDQVKVMIKSDGKVYSDLVAMVGDGSDAVFLHIRGHFTDQDLASLQSMISH